MKRAAGDENIFFSRLYLRTGRDNLLSYMFFGLRLSLQLQIYVRGLVCDHCLKSW